MNPTRWPVRVRLTVLYAAAFLAAGVVLVAVTYFLVSQTLFASPAAERLEHFESRPRLTNDTAQAIREAFEAYRHDTLSQLLTWSVVALAGALVLAVALGWVLAGRALRPLRQITETANRVADRSLHERISLAGPHDEVKELADTIDAMLERLDRSFDAQRRFVANASHELRTPLAVNRTLLEVALKEPDVSDDLKRLAPTLLATNERSEQLVEGLLTLARSEQEVTDRITVDLAELAAAAVGFVHDEAVELGMTVTTDLGSAPVAGNPVLLERLAVNLVQNAVRHGRAGAEAVVRTGRRGNASILQVENPGPVIRPYDVDGLFEPFRRGHGTAHSRGAGLGLSIVRSVAHAHGGRVAAHPREGGGFVVCVEIPSRHPPLVP